eukprot:10250660-Prorocentrum_lima.AAC.1
MLRFEKRGQGAPSFSHLLAVKCPGARIGNFPVVLLHKLLEAAQAAMPGPCAASGAGMPLSWVTRCFASCHAAIGATSRRSPR